MSKKKEPLKAFDAVMDIEITVNVANGVKKAFNLEVKTLGGAKLAKYSKDLAKSTSDNKTSKEEKKKISKAEKNLNRLTARLDDVEESISLLQENSGEDGQSEKILGFLAKKEVLQPKVWEAEDLFSELTENIEEVSVGETIVKADKEMKKLFELIVIKDDGLAAFMENEEIGYMSMTQYIKEKMEEERGND